MNILLCLQAGEILAWGFVSEPSNTCFLVGGVLTGCSQFDQKEKEQIFPPPPPPISVKTNSECRDLLELFNMFLFSGTIYALLPLRGRQVLMAALLRVRYIYIPFLG